MDPHLSLLIVDDDNKILESLSELLTPLFRKVHSAPNVIDALKICKTTRVDIVITDLLLPGKDGFDLIEWLNKNVRTMGIPVIVITGVRKDPKAVAKAKELNVDKFISKPFNAEELKSSVQAALTKDHRIRKLLSVIEDLKNFEGEFEQQKVESIQKCKNTLMETNKSLRAFQRELSSINESENSSRADAIKKHIEKLKEKVRKLEEQLSKINAYYKEKQNVVQKTRLSVYNRQKAVETE